MNLKNKIRDSQLCIVKILLSSKTRDSQICIHKIHQILKNKDSLACTLKMLTMIFPDTLLSEHIKIETIVEIDFVNIVCESVCSNQIKT